MLYICYVSYNYAINYDTQHPIFLINTHIGHDKDAGQGIDGKVFTREFFEVDNKNPELIKTLINSMGGCVINSYDIFGAINAAKSKTETTYAGLAFSSSGWAGMGADVVSAYDYASWMCHLPYGSNNKDFLEQVANSIAIIISEKSGKNGKEKMSVDKVLKLMNQKTYYSAQDLYDIGLIDYVIQTGSKIKIKNEINEEEITDTYKEYQLVVNKFLENKNDNTMAFEKVINRLNLADGSGEQAIIEEIALRENRFNALNKEKIELEDKYKSLNDSQEELSKKLKDAQNTISNSETSISNKEKEVLELKEKFDALNKEAEELKEKIAAAELEAKNKEAEDLKLKVSNMIQSYVDKGVVKNDPEVIAAYNKKGIEDFDYVKADLESRPINFEAPVTIQIDDVVVNDASKEGSFAWFAAQNQAIIDEEEKKRDEALRQLAGVVK